MRTSPSSVGSRGSSMKIFWFEPLLCRSVRNTKNMHWKKQAVTRIAISVISIAWCPGILHLCNRWKDQNQNILYSFLLF